MEVIVYQDKTTAMIYSVLMIIVGLLFVLNKDLALSWGFIIAGVFLIIAGIIPMIMAKSIDLMGLLMIVLGIILIAVPQLFAGITVLLIGIVAILLGVIWIYGSATNPDGKGRTIGIVVGIVILVAGIATFLGNDFVFIVFGILLIIAGIMNITGASRSS